MTGPVILAFDTSAPHCAAALLSAETGALLETRQEEMARGQGERLMPMVLEMMDAVGVAMADLAALGVGIGPGNFTGVRISVSAARGLALARAIPAVGVSTLEAMALGTDAPVLCTLDARRDMFYAQTFNTGRSEPVLCTLDALPWPTGGQAVTVIGHRADELAAHAGTEVRAPAYPLAEAIARIALARRLDPGLARPAPLYLRAADAAPPSDPPPVILP